ncbi:DH domain-containing protein [Plasmodiophora brassicae]
MTTGEQQQQQQQWATGGPVAVRRTTWSAASRPTDAAVSEATWQAALSSLRAGDTGKPVVDILKTHCQYSKRLLIELTTWPVDDLPGATVLNAVLGVVRRDTAIWLLTDADADQHYAQVLLSAKLGLAHPHALLRQCWSHALDLLLHEHLTRLPFPSLIVAFILTASIDPRLRLRWLTATVAFIRQLYKYGGQHRDLAPLQTLAAHADDLARFAIGSLSDANEGVRGRAAALLRLLLPICDADAATEAIPALLSAMDRHGTSSGSVHSGGTEASTRCRVEREIVMTEESYVAGLETLMRKVMEPLRAKRVIPDDKACALFANLPSIAALNKLLLADLQECSCTVQCACVPGVFVRFAGVFKLYSEYVNGFDRCLQMLSDLRDNVAFNRFLAGTGVQLTSLMISPIQRIPRYLLLLQELARHTPSDHTAFTVIQQAVDKIRAIADHLNDSKKRVEDLTKLLTLQARIAGRAPSLVKPDRELLLDGIVRKRSSSSTALSRRHARHVFVFSDMILWCTPSYRFKGQLELSHTDSSRVYEARDEFVLDVVGSRRSIQLEFGARHDRDHWHAVVDDAIRAMQERRQTTLRTGTVRMKNLLERDLQRAVQSQTPSSTPVKPSRSAPGPTRADPATAAAAAAAATGAGAAGPGADPAPPPTLTADCEAVRTLHALVLLYSDTLGGDTADMITDEVVKAVERLHRSSTAASSSSLAFGRRGPGLLAALLAYCADRLSGSPCAVSAAIDSLPDEFSRSPSSSRESSPAPIATTGHASAASSSPSSGEGSSSLSSAAPSTRALVVVPGEPPGAARSAATTTMPASDLSLSLFPIVFDLVQLCPSPLSQSDVFRQGTRCLAAAVDRAPRDLTAAIVAHLDACVGNHQHGHVDAGNDDHLWRRQALSMLCLGLVAESQSVTDDDFEIVSQYAPSALSSLSPSSSSSWIANDQVEMFAAQAASCICRRRLAWLSESTCLQALDRVSDRIAADATTSTALPHALRAAMFIVDGDVTGSDDRIQALALSIVSRLERVGDTDPTGTVVAALECLLRCLRHRRPAADEARVVHGARQAATRVLKTRSSVRCALVAVVILRHVVNAETAAGILVDVCSRLEQCLQAKDDDVDDVQVAPDGIAVAADDDDDDDDGRGGRPEPANETCLMSAIVDVVAACMDLLPRAVLVSYLPVLAPIFATLLEATCAMANPTDSSGGRHDLVALAEPPPPPPTATQAERRRRSSFRGNGGDLQSSAVTVAIAVADCCATGVVALRIGAALLVVLQHVRQRVLDRILHDSLAVVGAGEASSADVAVPVHLETTLRCMVGLTQIWVGAEGLTDTARSDLRALGLALVRQLADTVDRVPAPTVLASAWAQGLFVQLLDSWSTIVNVLQCPDADQLRSRTVFRVVDQVVRVHYNDGQHQHEDGAVDAAVLRRLPAAVARVTLWALRDLVYLHQALFLDEVLRLAPCIGPGLHWAAEPTIQQSAADLLQQVARVVQRPESLLPVVTDDVVSGLVVALNSVVGATRRSACLCIGQCLLCLQTWALASPIVSNDALVDAFVQCLPLPVGGGDDDDVRREDNQLLCRSLAAILSSCIVRARGGPATEPTRSRQHQLAVLAAGRIPAIMEALQAEGGAGAAVLTACKTLKVACTRVLGKATFEVACREWSPTRAPARAAGRRTATGRAPPPPPAQ